MKKPVFQIADAESADSVLTQIAASLGDSLLAMTDLRE